MRMTLREIRESKGVKKGAVAWAIGVSYPTYKAYEENTEKMPAGKLAQACEFLGCSREDIFLPTDCS